MGMFKVTLFHRKVDPVVEADVPTKSATKGAMGLTGSKKSKLGWKSKKQRKAKREEKNAIQIQSVVRGVIGRDVARAERQQQNATRLQSLVRGRIARDLIKSNKAEETSAARIQSIARGSIARNKVRTDNTAATRIQCNHRGHVVRKRQNRDKEQEVQQDQALDEESFFDTFFVMSCCTGWAATKSVEADLSETHKTSSTEGPATNELSYDESADPSELSTAPEEVDSQ
jgi:hypothetical protein